MTVGLTRVPSDLVLLHLELGASAVVCARAPDSPPGHATAAILALDQARLRDAWDRGYRHLAVLVGRYPCPRL